MPLQLFEDVFLDDCLCCPRRLLALLLLFGVFFQQFFQGFFLLVSSLCIGLSDPLRDDLKGGKIF